jgi:hypothetical protein
MTTTTTSKVPRRIRLDQNVPAELAIRAAVDAVEEMPADTRLTRAVILLSEALEFVADFVDGVPLRVSPTHDGPTPAPFDTQPDDREWQAATDELFEALGEGYGITRLHAKGLAFRMLCAARRAVGGPHTTEGHTQ